MRKTLPGSLEPRTGATRPTLDSPLAEGRVARVYPWEEGTVLKLAREWVPHEWIAHEFRITAIVHAAGVPTPKPHALIEHAGAAGIIYDRLEGPTMLDRIGTAPQRAGKLGRMLGKLHADIHARQGAPDLPDNNDRLQKRIASIAEAPDEYRQAAQDALARLPRGSSLLHGDFHPGNVILTPDGPVVIDWPDASRGHPLSDVARTVVLASLGGLPEQALLRLLVRVLRNFFKRAYLRTYFKRSGLERRELDGWLYPVIFARFAEGIESERLESIRWLDRLRPIPHRG